MGEPGGGFEKVRGDGIGVEELGDGFGGKVDLGDFSQDDTGDDFFAEGNEDEVTRSEFEVGRIGQYAAAGAENFGGDDLIKHRFIIACS